MGARHIRFVAVAGQVRRVVVVGAVLLGLSLRAYGQAGSGRQTPERNFLPELKTIASRLSERYGVRVAIDPLIFVSQAPRVPGASRPVDGAMDDLAASIRGTAWRRVYRGKSQEGADIQPMIMAAIVRGLAQLEASQLVIEDVSAQSATTFVKGSGVTAALTNTLGSEKLGEKPIYLLYATSLPKRLLQAQLMDLQREHAQIVSGMTREEIAQSLTGMEPQALALYVGTFMGGMMEYVSKLSPEDQKLMRNAVESIAEPGEPKRP